MAHFVATEIIAKFACMKHNWLIISLIALLLGACGHGKTYRVEGVLDDGSSINLRILTYADQAVVPGITASQEGKFRFEAAVENPVMVEMYDNDYRLLTRFVARPGDDIKLRIDRAHPYLSQVKGNDISESWSKYLISNASKFAGTSAETRNAAVAQYIRANPSSELATLLLITEYDAAANPVAADSLFRLIAPEARAMGFEALFTETYQRYGLEALGAKVRSIPYRLQGNDTALYRTSSSPHTLIAVSDRNSGRDSVVAALRSLARSDKRLKLLDLSIDSDTTEWHYSIVADSASWTQGWLPGGTAARSVEALSIPSSPYFIIADSTGRQLWRGSSISKARKFVDNLKR